MCFSPSMPAASAGARWTLARALGARTEACAAVVYGKTAERALEEGWRLGIDCCAVCGAPETEASVECEACEAVVYCCEAHKSKDKGVHAAVCPILRLSGDLDVETVEKATVKQGVKRVVAALARMSADERSRALTSWKPLLRLADGCSEAVQRRIGDVLSYPLSVFAAHARFPQVRRALSTDTSTVHVHFVGASKAECGISFAWRTLPPSCQLDVPLVVTFVGLDVPKRLHGADKALGGPSRARFHRGDYHSFAASEASPCLIVGCNMGLSCPDYDWSSSLRAIAAANCPLLVTTNTLPELSMEQEVLTDAFGFRFSGMGENPFACPCPAQSGTMANDVYRKNELISVFLPPIAPRERGRKRPRGG